MYADLGIAPRPRVSEVHVDAAEIAHRRIYEGVRPALAAAKAPENLWELCAQDFIAKANCAAGNCPPEMCICAGDAEKKKAAEKKDGRKPDPEQGELTELDQRVARTF